MGEMWGTLPQHVGACGLTGLELSTCARTCIPSRLLGTFHSHAEVSCQVEEEC